MRLYRTMGKKVKGGEIGMYIERVKVSPRNGENEYY